MEEQMEMETSPSMDSLDVNTIRRRVDELNDVLTSCKEDISKSCPLEAEKLLNQCVLDLEDRMEQILLESSLAGGGSSSSEDSSAFLERMKEELTTMETEKTEISKEIEILTKSIMADSITLESDLEFLKYSLDYTAMQGLDKGKAGKCVTCLCNDNQLNSGNVDVDEKFEMLHLQSQIEKKRMLLKSLQNLDYELKKYDAIEQIADALTGIKVIDFDEKCIRLSLKTFISKPEDSQQNLDDFTETSELNHELLIEVVDANLEPENVEIFPNDVYIIDIVDAAKSFRQSLSQLVVPQTSLDWLVRRVQERIVVTTLRRFAVKNVNKSRYFAEYLDRDEMIVAHFAGEVDAFLEASQGWPLSNTPLKLQSLKYSGNSEKRINLGFLCKVQEAVNSLDEERRTDLACFLDAIEMALVDQMCLLLHSDCS